MLGCRSGIGSYVNRVSARVGVRIRTCRPTSIPLLQEIVQEEEEESQFLRYLYIISTAKE